MAKSSAAIQPDEQQAAARRILLWREKGPAQFAVDTLQLPMKWNDASKEGILDWQWEASEALVKKKRLSIRSGHRVGKTAFASWTIMWFVTCFFPTKVGVTAPTSVQMSDVLWAELSMWHNRMKRKAPMLGEQFMWRVDRFELIARPRESFAVARTARPERPEALQGLHSKNVLILVDEASGVDERIFEAGRGSLAAENSYIILTSNPTRLSGYFYETHHKLRSLWHTIHVNGKDVPTQSQQYRDEIYLQYGEDSNYSRVRIDGEFPKEEADVVISLELVLAASQREVEAFGSKVWGLDVARFGDDRNVLIKRCTNATLGEHQAWRGMDTMQTSGKVYAEWLNTPPEDRPTTIFVDVIGIGAGVCDRLGELGLPVVGINVSEAASIDDRKYERLRDELWFKARRWFERLDCKIVPDETLIAELVVPKYTFNSSGKIKVESKDDIKKRLPRSPDVADALILTFADMAEYKGRQSYEPEEYADGV